MIYVPKRAIVPNKVCIVDDSFYNANNEIGKGPMPVIFSSKINNPPIKTLAIITNEFSGPFMISEIKQPGNSAFYARLMIKNAINSNLNPTLKVDIRYWSLNEIFMEGIVQKGGNILDEAKFVAVTYGQYSTMVLKDGAIYRKILNL